MIEVSGDGLQESWQCHKSDYSHKTTLFYMFTSVSCVKQNEKCCPGGSIRAVDPLLFAKLCPRFGFLEDNSVKKSASMTKNEINKQANKQNLGYPL